MLVGRFAFKCQLWSWTHTLHTLSVLRSLCFVFVLITIWFALPVSLSLLFISYLVRLYLASLFDRRDAYLFQSNLLWLQMERVSDIKQKHCWFPWQPTSFLSASVTSLAVSGCTRLLMWPKAWCQRCLHWLKGVKALLWLGHVSGLYLFRDLNAASVRRSWK